jgi:predicted DNA-binding mobile mystery protein A
MKNAQRATKARRRLDRRFSDHNRLLENLAVPGKGWIRAIREALGMTAAQLGVRMGLAQQSSVATLEASEAKGTIQLSSLQRAAEAMNCTLLYAFVPNGSLEAFVQERARQVAAAQLRPVEQTMRLENQGLSESDSRALLEDYIRNTLDPRRLWDEPAKGKRG